MRSTVESERVWERYLTDEERQRYRQRRPPRQGFGNNPALLLIDLYRCVFGDRPQSLAEALPRWPSSCGLAGWQALPHIQRLLALARDAGIPVIHATGVPDVPSWRIMQADPMLSDPEARERSARERARDFEIIEEVAPVPGEQVIRKAAPSAFFGTPLVGYCNQLRIDSLLVSGESTSGCVRATVVDASSHRLRVTVVEECVFDRTETAHAINLFDMSHKYADVLPLAEVEAYLATRGSAHRAR